MTAASRARIRHLLMKEWYEFKGSKILLGTGLSVPIVMTVMAVGMLATVSAIPADSDPKAMAEIRGLLGDRAALFTNVRDGMALYLGEMALMLLLLAPVTTPTILAANTIVREKQSRCLESILTTPVRTWELVISKQFFCVTIGVLPVFVGVAVFYAVAHTMVPPLVFRMLASPAWLLTCIVSSPLIAIFAVAVATAISARASDVQSAQQAAGLVIMPVMAFMAVQASGLASLSFAAAAGLTAVIVFLDVFAVAFAISLFERENVLTRWK